MRRAPVVEPRPPSLRRFGQLGFCAGDRGNETKKNSGHNGGNQRHEKHAQIEIGFGDPRDGLRSNGAEQIQSPDGEKHAGQSADERQQNTFREHLPQQTRRPRAEGDSNREFAFARSGPREQHGGQIRAGDQENERDRAEQNDQRCPHSADDLIVKVVERGAKAGRRLIVIRKSGQPTGDNGIDLRLRLRKRYPWLQPANDAVAARAARLQIVLGEGNRLPEIDLLSESAALHVEQGQRKLEFLRHDPDDREAASIERELLSDEFGIGVEPALPKALTDYDHVVVALTKLVWRKGAAAHGLNAEHGKQTRGHDGAGDPLRHFTGGEIEIDVIKACDVQTLELLFVIEILRRRHREFDQGLAPKISPTKARAPADSCRAGGESAARLPG